MEEISPPSNRKRVALLVETSLSSGREILRGIARHARETDRWLLSHAAGGLMDQAPEWFRTWEGDGVIARIQSPDLASVLREIEVPVIDVLGVVEEAPFPLVHVDDQLIAEEAARHFAERDFRHFGFFGIAGENWSERRRDGFCGACSGPVSVLELPREAEVHLESPDDRLRSWLRSLPKPVGVLVASDQRGLVLLEACRAEGLAVPEQVAVVGVDNDLPLCEISSPPLSSLRAGHFRVGYEAARLLGAMMEGRTVSADEALYIPPTEVVIRGSSDTLAIDDPAVAQGVRFLREHLAEPVTNDVVSRAVGLSRTLFQQRFRAAMGQTVREYLTTLRLRRARSLIETSDLTLADIAQRCGFKHQEYLGDVFRKHFGITPGRLRKTTKEG
ncbi:MAG: DNA-binding transcriptional regulator [Verrucomicrobiae bacterium]|nr:DNA-binding transcriptional regulator [Verrucomicrobiae bacterium]